jgi:HK97 gp10 family phage protein
MPGRVNIKVDGARQIEAALKELGVQAANRVARSALNRSATPVVKRAKKLAPTPGDPDDPYATGLLKKAITKRLRRQRRGSDRESLIAGIERPVASRYAPLVEFGSSRRPAEASLRPASDETAHQVLQVQRQAMLDGIERETQGRWPVLPHQPGAPESLQDAWEPVEQSITWAEGLHAGGERGPGCGEQFVPRAGRQKYCQPECRDQASSPAATRPGGERRWALVMPGDKVN